MCVKNCASLSPDSPEWPVFARSFRERSRWQRFSEAVALQSRKHAALKLDCTGPWPPYDFVRMQFTA